MASPYREPSPRDDYDLFPGAVARHANTGEVLVVYARHGEFLEMTAGCFCCHESWHEDVAVRAPNESEEQKGATDR